MVQLELGHYRWKGAGDTSQVQKHLPSSYDCAPPTQVMVPLHQERPLHCALGCGGGRQALG